MRIIFIFKNTLKYMNKQKIIKTIPINKNFFHKVYGEIFTVDIYLISNDETIVNNTFRMIACEKTTLFNILKFYYQTIYPEKNYNPDNEVHILWRTENAIDFDKIRTIEYKNIMTLEYLKFYYDDIYTKYNHIFLKIFDK